MQTWTMSQRGTQRFHREMHPWIFSNEFSARPSAHPGSLVQVEDHRGHLVAYGYGNLNSLISVRILSRNVATFDAKNWMRKRLRDAYQARQKDPRCQFSFRWVFSEADELPGMVVDVYRTTVQPVIVAQLLTAGVDDASTEMILHETCEELFDRRFSLIIRRDAKIRQLEGLKQEPTVVLGLTVDPEVDVLLYHAFDTPLSIKADLITGQKTGMFLDQRDHILRVLGEIPQDIPQVVDLFSHLGQWGFHIAKARPNSRVHFYDASERALECAAATANQFGDRFAFFRRDLLTSFPSEELGDVVICDPPALIKSKKDFHVGVKAYVKTFKNAVQITKPGGHLFLSSCSHHLDIAEFEKVVSLATEGKRFRRIANGFQSADHPVMSYFPQGLYLKSVFLRRES